MSIESAQAFLDRLDSDVDLRAELFESAGENAQQVSVSAERLAELGAKRGLAFTSEEIRQALAGRGGSTSGELSQGELDAVAGGVRYNDFVITKKIDKSTPILG